MAPYPYASILSFLLGVLYAVLAGFVIFAYKALKRQLEEGLAKVSSEQKQIAAQLHNFATLNFRLLRALNPDKAALVAEAMEEHFRLRREGNGAAAAAGAGS